MRGLQFRMLRRCLGCLAVVLLLACHDAKRNNPLDPDLTPAVELSAALDSTSGAVTLSWTAYEGQMPFAHYAVQRSIVDRMQRGARRHRGSTSTSCGPERG